MVVPAKWRAIAEDVVEFELQLLQAGTAESYWKDPANFHTPLSVEELSLLTPSIDWHVVLQDTLPLGINNSQPISVLSTPYQEKLEALLQRTSSRTLQNHFVWQLIWRLSTSLAPEYYQPIREFSDILYGIPAGAGKKRWDICSSVVNEYLGQMLGYYFVQDHDSGNSRAMVVGMMESIKSTFHRDLRSLSWLDNSTRNAALEKLEAMTALVGFSTESPNVESALSLQQHYKAYQVHPGEFFLNRIRYGMWYSKREFLGLNKPVNRKSLDVPPQSMKAYYNVAMNQILFPAAVLQPPFFHQDYPEYINFGGIGWSLAHEITHGFDDLGRHFDKTGRKINWWTNETEQAFAAKAQCFVDQYSQYTVQGPDGQLYNVSGESTMSENIVDNGGMRLAYKGWKARFDADEAKVRNFKLFGLEDYTAEQLFFISFGRFWCQKQQPMHLYSQILYGKHSPDQWRVNGVLQNSPAFAKAFNCSLGSPMNPEKKCEMW
ncbi:hypothetical protein BGZ72_001603 [Mortierella alpina]|nr:hypothetical protein BGZ72_001603 [Mortierella alpina]